MALLGDDGRGYELARKLESCGVWRSWLGDSIYANFVQFLASPSTWDSFMRTDDSKSRAQIQLQLRVRALLFDKATASLFIRSTTSSSSSSTLLSSPSSVSVSKLNPAYLQLHGDDVYYTLESSLQNGGTSANAASSKNQSKSVSGMGSRYVDAERDGMSQRYRNEELPETWYNQFIEKYRSNKQYRVTFGDRESQKRSPEEMASYLMHISNHKKRRLAYKEDQHLGFGNSLPEHASNMQLNGGNSVDDDSSIFPEIMFTLNCVPDSALPPTNKVDINRKVKLYGVLDTLPPVTTRSAVMIERLGIRPEYLNMEPGGSLYRGNTGSEGNRKLLSQEQASKMSQQVVARMLTVSGFEAAMEVPIEVFSQLLSCHICKLGKTLKVLADNYRKQCSAIELLKMLLKTMGYSNFGPLVDLIKDGSKNIVQQGQQQIHGIQQQVQPSQQSSVRLHPQVQVQRQIHPQMQQIIHSQNMAFQQQQQQQQQHMRRRQASTPRPAMDTDKDRPLVQVKLENPPDLPIENNASFSSINTRHPQMQLRQQQMAAALSNFHAQSGNQFRLGSLQIPQMHSPNMGMVRAPPVKVEGFSELMGGDSSSKHDTEEGRLTSPTGK
ncbi:hypothetical protein L6164_020505 [Bauhinia variegata]|uniref:Uncharacterized protein n=1 Tax=Bauhinia variegata TaxID=167791 RepID=A0ACB9MV94_BAUVA|nr:hypothetical protein L6164_020505 [Bauhinia variegata]